MLFTELGAFALLTASGLTAEVFVDFAAASLPATDFVRALAFPPNPESFAGADLCAEELWGADFVLEGFAGFPAGDFTAAGFAAADLAAFALPMAARSPFRRALPLTPSVEGRGEVRLGAGLRPVDRGSGRFALAALLPLPVLLALLPLLPLPVDPFVEGAFARFDRTPFKTGISDDPDLSEEANLSDETARPCDLELMAGPRGIESPGESAAAPRLPPP